MCLVFLLVVGVVVVPFCLLCLFAVFSCVCILKNRHWKDSLYFVLVNTVNL